MECVHIFDTEKCFNVEAVEEESPRITNFTKARELTKVAAAHGKLLTLIRLGFLKVVFSAGRVMFQEELIWYQYNLIQLLINLFKVGWR